MISPREALERLREGNRRFVSDDCPPSMSTHQKTRDAQVAGQAPFAAILGCADSRAPAELIFDHGLGELFVVRVAGNIVAPSLVGSLEFAVDALGTRLVVVLGHSGCGAVGSTLADLESPLSSASPSLRSILDSIRPAIEPVVEAEARVDGENENGENEDGASLLGRAVRANVRASVLQLRQKSPLLDRLAENGELWIVGAEYSLDSGQVDFFDGLPEG